MQQQMPQEQCGNQQQIGQPVMLCPVQYVYDAPVMLPQPPPQEEQIQQNQILINVKNPPPWIQNRPQNQVVYVQQLPNNYQPYIHSHMIQNPMYHPQMTYQIQPLLAQDNRQFIQIPSVNHYNMVQNPPTQIIKEETEKMPLLTQMLSQKTLVNRTTNVNNVRPTTTVNMIRPTTQNQQVQTDNVSPNIKGRPRNVPPQIITINPMQQRQLARKQETIMNVRPTNIRNDVPQHIRTKIPNSISVKSINNTRTIIRPFDVMSSPHNFYYDSNRNSLVMSAPYTENKNIMTNTGYLKPNCLQETNIRTAMPMQYPIQVSNVPPFVNMTTLKNEVGSDNINQIVNVNAIVKPNETILTTNDDINKNHRTETNAAKNTESETQNEEKLVRNTVFVQARGRVLNDKEISQNQCTKRTFDDRPKEEEKQETTLNIDANKSSEEALNISKKIKIEASENYHESNEFLMNSSAANMNIKTQQSRISNLQMNTDNISQHNADNSQKPTIDAPEMNRTKNVLVVSSQLSENIKLHNEENNSVKASTEIEKNNIPVEKAKALIEMTDKVSNDSDVKEESVLNNVKKKEGKITVLTHVLEGYIIQESNVAFPIQKPTMEKEIKKQVIPKNNEQNIGKTTNEEENACEKHESKSHSTWKCLNTSIESDKEMEFATIDRDNPFSNIKKSTVEKWTAEQLSSHLEKHKWTETAAKLLDEEIDGESILLVNKDQLVAIGVSEEHAEVIGAFVAS